MEYTQAEYARLPGINWSKLKVIGRSPAHFVWASSEMSDEDTDAKRLGRARHVAVFESEKFASKYAIWSGGIRRGKAWKAFEAAHLSKGQEILTDREAEEVFAFANAANANPMAQRYLAGSGQSEVVITWQHTLPALGDRDEVVIPCKARLDYVSPSGAILDLKSTRDASPDGFGKEVWRYEHHVQAAWYSDGYYAATGKRLPFVLLAVENVEPYVAQVYRVPERIIELGRERYTHLLNTYAQCQADGEWPAYSDDELDLELPRWAVQFHDDDDVSDLGLIIGGA